MLEARQSDIEIRPVLRPTCGGRGVRLLFDCKLASLARWMVAGRHPWARHAPPGARESIGFEPVILLRAASPVRQRRD